MTKKIITEKDIETLFNQQLNQWELARQNYDAMKNIKTKDIDFDGFKIKVQFNPARITSTTAKVDALSLKERKCFLCLPNLPSEERGLSYDDDYQILVNPYPIFPIHYTIPCYDHTNQRIIARFTDMLDMAKRFENYVIFYNGPKSGASAPDHFHFQAGTKDYFPLCYDIKNLSQKTVWQNEHIKVFNLENYLRNVFVIESADKRRIESAFKEIYYSLETMDDEIEPMMNILSWFENEKWICSIFPRKVHRPKCFFVEGDEKIIITPGSAEMAGLFITPNEKDFDKINAEIIREIFEEI